MELLLSLVWKETCRYGVETYSHEFIYCEALLAVELEVFVVYVGIEHRRIVTVDANGDTAVDEPAYGVVLYCLHSPGSEVADRAGLDRDTPRLYLAEEGWVCCRRDPVTDAFYPECLYCTPDTLRPRCFACVGDEVEPEILRLLVCLLIGFWWESVLASPDVDGDDVVVLLLYPIEFLEGNLGAIVAYKVDPDCACDSPLSLRAWLFRYWLNMVFKPIYRFGDKSEPHSPP